MWISSCLRAEFFQTQAVYDIDNLKRFMDFAGRFDVKILAGIVLLTSACMATYMNQSVAGIYVPENLVSEMASVPKGGALNKGIEIAGRHPPHQGRGHRPRRSYHGHRQGNRCAGHPVQAANL